MSAEESAYAALGLRPGARRSEVDAAYRRLMKIHHPDRSGGDGSRAAEINRAYTLLCRDYPARPPRARTVPVPVRPPRRSRSGRAGWALTLVAAVSAAVVLYVESPIGSRRSSGAVRVQWVPTVPRELAGVVSSRVDFEEPLHSRVIVNAIADAISFHSSGDLEGATAYSRDCHNRLRQEPNLALFDACAAFDESTLTLNASGPLIESGPFNGPSVMAREMAAARALSDDVFAADSRLHQIRSRVELALLPKLDEAAALQRP